MQVKHLKEGLAPYDDEDFVEIAAILKDGELLKSHPLYSVGSAVAAGGLDSTVVLLSPPDQAIEARRGDTPRVRAKIHTTIGIYANGERVVNGCPSDELADHITYNIKMRPGRALFLDGYCIHRGYLNREDITPLEMAFIGPDGPRATEASNPRR